MTLDTFDDVRLQHRQPDEISDSLERGAIVYFPQSPVKLPAEADLEFFRQQLPRLLKRKNVSYHPEAAHTRGLKNVEAEVTQRVNRVLKTVSADIADFLDKVAPRLTRDWTVGTCSFRPLEEQGRNLSAHASNELIHIDAGAYGATHGDRILRFFINVNPQEERVWATKGNFPELFVEHGEHAGLGHRNAGPGYLSKGLSDHLRSGVVNLAAYAMPVFKVLDSSPYDRVMRKFHNYMKDTPSFQQQQQGHQEFRFPPFSAWMVYTDMVSHACLSGQHAFVHTSLVRLQNCHFPELAPINTLRSAALSHRSS